MTIMLDQSFLNLNRGFSSHLGDLEELFVQSSGITE
jgi:hypothetical protein